MNRKSGPGWLLAVAIAVVTLAAACGSSNNGSSSKGSITVGAFNFPESRILAEVYGQELAHDGYTVTIKPPLGTREVVAPALEHGQIDMYIGYAATDLEYYNKAAGEANGDPVATTAKLNSHLQSLGLVALTPSNAVDQNAFAVTKDTQSKYSLKQLSDLTAVGNQLVLGAGPECPSRPFCLPGLMNTYGIHFKAFKALDTDGPLTRAAFKNGTIQVGLVFSSDADLNSLNLIVLQDDKHLENADNIVPILRSSVASGEVKSDLNKVSAGLTTADLINMNGAVSLQNQDPEAVAKAYLQQHNFFS